MSTDPLEEEYVIKRRSKKMAERSNSHHLRHYPSTPHLDTFNSGIGGGGSSFSEALPSQNSFKNHTLSGASSNANLFANTYMPKSNFSTFIQQKKPVPPPKISSLSNNNISYGGGRRAPGSYQDDPNPYKITMIGECRIKVNDPFLPSKSPASHGGSQFSFYTQTYEEEDNDAEEMRQAFGKLDMNQNNKGRRLSEDEGEMNGSQHHPMFSCNGSGKVHRSATLKSTSGESRMGQHRRSESASVSASSTSTGEIDIGEFILPDPDYEGFHHPEHGHDRVAPNVAEEGVETGRGSGSGIIIPGPISDSSCTGSEGYSSVSAATSCSASEPDPYAVPNTGRNSSSPDEGSILESNDSGTETPTRISEEDRIKIEHALMGQKTTIFVSDCMANMYWMKRMNFLSRPNSSLSNHTGSYSGQSSSSNLVDPDYQLQFTGVPVLLLDLGETKSRDKRRIQIVMADINSGLALWKDVIDNLSSYKVMEGSHSFHTMHLSTDHTKVIGFSFDDEECAEAFYQRVEKLTSDFKNISLSGSKSKFKKEKGGAKAKGIKAKFVKPKKSEISLPCGFSHISSLTTTDKKRFASLQNFFSGRGNKGGNNQGGEPKPADHSSAASSSSSNDNFVSMSPLALADSHGSDMHF